MLTRDQKAKILEELKAKFKEYQYFYLIDFTGLTAQEMYEFRKKLTEAGNEYRVAKNTLIRIALESQDNKDDYEEVIKHLHGPNSVILTTQPAVPARIIKEIRKKWNKEVPSLRVAYIEGGIYIGDKSLDDLAQLKTKEELIGDVLALLMSPIRNVLAALNGQAQQLAGALKTLAEKKEKEQ